MVKVAWVLVNLIIILAVVVEVVLEMDKRLQIPLLLVVMVLMESVLEQELFLRLLDCLVNLEHIMELE